jgi:CRP-like cAMP-binding protein
MSSPKESRFGFENHLLAALPREEYQHLLPHLEQVRLMQGRILYNPGDNVRYAYFLRGGMVSLLTISEDGRTIEVGMIGNEGLAGIPVILGASRAPYQIMVQLTANAMRIKGDLLREEFKRGGQLHDLLLRYTNTILTQLAQSVACNRFHTVEERCCRWLLICRDRVQTDTLLLTQEFISYMLGVPRTSVTMIAGDLQKKNLIRYRRGRIIILNRQGLERASCECYRLIQEEIDHYLAA